MSALLLRLWKTALRTSMLVVVAACADEGESAPTARVVVGLTSDLAIGFDIERVVVTMRVDGVVVRTQDLRYVDGRLLLPAEFSFDRVEDGSVIDASFEAFDASDGALLVWQRGTTTAEAGRTPLLQLALQEACIDVECVEGEACTGGACISVERSSASLPAYDPDWIDDAIDACRPAGAVAMLEVGEGRDAFAAIEDGATLTLEAGPQGGYHVWLAVRAFGVRQQGSLVEARASLPTLDREVPALLSVVTFDRVDDACELSGLRFRVDDGIAVEELLGRELALELTLSDSTGATQTAKRSVFLSDMLQPLP